MKRFLIYLSVTVFFLWLFVFFAGSALFTYFTDSKRDELVALAERVGITELDYSYDQVTMVTPYAVSWRNIHASFFYQLQQRILPLTLDIPDITLAVTGLSPLVVQLTAREIECIGRTSQMKRLSGFAFLVNRLEFAHPVAVDDISGTFHNVIKKFSDIMRGEHADIKMKLDGYLRLVSEEHQQLLRVITKDFPDGLGLALHEEDLRRYIDDDIGTYTNAELSLVANYPLRALDLIQIKDTAERTTRQAFERDPSIPVDAYRHILWNYLLTKRYGRDFAKLVTDAHEQDGKDENFLDHEMDYLNNKIGREYAERKIPEEKILPMLRRDSRVVIKPSS